MNHDLILKSYLSKLYVAPRHVTVSTVGVIKNMYRLAEDLPHVNLALSLHAPNQTLRQKIIPTAGGSPIYALMKAVANHIDKNCRKKSHALEVDDVKNLSTLTAAIDDDFDESKEFLDSNGKRPAKSKYGYHGVMIEYILLAGLNDQEEHARELGALLAPFGDYVLLNLIPYNPTDVRETFVAPTREASEAFQRVCQSEPYLIHTRIRVEMGQDIAGACGQLVLKAKEVNKKNNDRSSDHIEIEDIAKSKIGNQKPSQSNVDTSDHKDESKKENNEAKPPSDHNAVLVSFTVAVALIGSFLLLRRLKLS